MPLPKRLKKEGIFTVRDLLSRLSREGFFKNKKTLWMLENKGVLPQPRRMAINKWNMRIYSKEEIDDILRIVRSLKFRKRIHVE